MRCACANERSLALYPGEDLLPRIVANVLEGDRQRLVEIDRLVEQINCALRFALFQSLLAESRAERQHFEGPKIAAAACYDKLHRTEMDIRLHTIKRHVPEIGDSPSGTAGHCSDCLLVAFLQLAQGTIRIRRSQSAQIVVERNHAHEQYGYLHH